MIHSTSTFSFYNLPPQYSSLSLAPHVSLRRVVTINNTRQNSATGSIPKLLKTRKNKYQLCQWYQNAKGKPNHDSYKKALNNKT